MNHLIDCDVLEYMRIQEHEQERIIKDSQDAQIKPVFALPVFEMCRALHLSFKYHNLPPADFRKCWSAFSETYWGNWLHISEYPEQDEYNLPLEICSLKRNFDENEKSNIPCENSQEQYWDGHTSLTLRLRTLCQKEQLDEMKPSMANDPDGRRETHCSESAAASGDLVMDANNLLDMLNSLPEEGDSGKVKIHFPSRLSLKARRWFNKIIESYGTFGKLIVPLSALEETERVSRKSEQHELKYRKARNVIKAICMNPEKALWNIFSFQSLTQDIFDCFQLLYEKLDSPHVKNQNIPSLGDTLVVAHGIYNRCPIASNEWFEKKDWAIVAQEFPFLELTDD